MPTIRTESDAAAYLEGLINLERDPAQMSGRLGLAPIRELMARLGHPERRLCAVHVAGSKGKGSTVLLAEALLRAAGLRTGAFTSPHLERWTERFRIDGAEVAGDVLAHAVAQLQPVIDAQRACGPPRVPSFFDATTAVAFTLFDQASLDCALVEVGLGGRLDSTNVISPRVTCITTIEREHVRFLGSRIAGIAYEKAGILKRSVPCVVGALPPEAAAVIDERAAMLDVPLLRLGREFSVRSTQRPDGVLECTTRFEDGFEVAVELELQGLHHAHNAALAVAAVRALGMLSDGELQRAALAGFAHVALPGRVEVLSRAPWVVVDGAHTEASAAALDAALSAFPAAARHFVVSLSSDKAVERVCGVLLAGAASATLTRADRNRSADPEALRASLQERFPSLALDVIDDPEAALRTARARIGPRDLLCATGSVYLAGIARRVLAACRA